MLAGSGHNGWRRADVLEGFTGPKGGPRVTLAMLQTASMDEFVGRVRGGEHLLVVADEVHRAGSPVLLRPSFLSRRGLASA